MTGARAGRLCWLDFDGEEMTEDGEVLKSATLDFQSLFLRSADEMPACPLNISGRPGRFRALMRMPEQWTEFFHGFSITGREMPTSGLEFLYEKAGGKLFHAVVDGAHPDGQGWHYRWEDGKSPAEIPVPDLPAWMIAGLVRHMANKVAGREERENRHERRERASSPFDQLSPGRQYEVLEEMGEFWPYRGGEVGTKFAGHYPTMCRLVLSLYKGVAHGGIFLSWLEDSNWNHKNDWDGRNGSAPVAGGSLEGFARSLMRSETEGEEVAPWGAAWAIAVENGWKPPKDIRPPLRVDLSKLSTGVGAKLKELKKGLRIIDLMKTPLERIAAYQNLGRALDVTEKELRMLLTQVQIQIQVHNTYHSGSGRERRRTRR